jgi:hypothetical protein
MNRICKKCNELLNIDMFYKNGSDAYYWKCKRCYCDVRRKNKNKEYKPHGKKNLEGNILYKTYKKKNDNVREEIIIDNDNIYVLLKRIENNGLKIGYIDALRLIDAYINVFGNDIPDFYTELKQFDIMFHRLNQYILKINEKKIKK